MNTYQIVAKNKKADITIYEAIGNYWDGGITPKQFSDDLKALGDIDEIYVHLNSPGGQVFDGNTIYNILKNHKARVIVDIEGLAASIASVIAMAGDEIRIAENGMMMVHNASAFAIGDAEAMRKTADMLDKTNSTIISTYAKRTGLDEEKVTDLMNAETWMTAKEALDYGFVDSITDAVEMAAHFDLEKFKYRNMPKNAAPTKDKEQSDPSEMRVKLASMRLKSQKIKGASTQKK